MAKTKNKKRVSSDKVHTKVTNRRPMIKTKSPFEVHINNEKLKVLGRKNKHNKGLPGISRAKAIDKRKKTLLKEYQIRNKSNVFTDKRIGEHSQALSTEEKQMARFAAVRVKAHKRKSIFNLGEDEELTHRGQTLREIENFDDPRSDDEDFDDQNETGKLDKQFVGEAHFGGGVLTRTGAEGFKSHRDLIEQLIAESKKRKAEKQKIKESTMELTEKLDTEWKDLLPLVSKHKRESENNLEKPKVDDYDKMMRELKFEARGTVSDRLKSERELAEEEKEKLEVLERGRIERMKGISDNKLNKNSHRSADDLDDDFVYEDENEMMLSYNKDGQSNVSLDDHLKENKSENEQSEAEESSQSEAETESEDNLSDLKEENSNSEDEDMQSEKENVKINLKEESSKTEDEDFKSEDKNAKINECNDLNVNKISRDNLSEKKIEMDKAREELPYTFSMPENYEQLYSTLIKYPHLEQGTVIERMIQCNHSSLAKGNKDNLGILFVYILQYINDMASDAVDEQSLKHCFCIFKTLIPQLFDLAEMNQINCHNAVLEVIKEKCQDYWKNRKEYPGLENLLFLKLIDILFTTSDFRHQIVTPCLIYIEQMLMKCRVSTKRHISYGLFLSTLALEYTSFSKRFMPGCINYLGGIIHMAIPKSTVRLIKVIPPFKSISSDLVLVESQSSNKSTLKMEITDLLGTEITESFKVRAFYLALKLTNEFCDNFTNLSSNVEIFDTLHKYCELIPKHMYPELVQDEIDDFLKRFDGMGSERKLKHLVMEAKRPKALRLYEPKIVEIYDGKRYKVQSKEKAERDKLIHKLKRERKGALREIRKDNAFLGSVKIKQQIHSDQERKAKVKRIFAEASIQQSELNAIDRKKKKK